MRIAIASTEGSVTRYFEDVCCFEIFDAQDGDQTRLPDLHADLSTVFEKLKSAGVDLLICGSMDHKSEASVRKSGIKITRDVLGLTRDALSAWQAGYLNTTDSPMCKNARF
ncbi:MAG: hypothetical protein EOM51_06380 [Clostridia bacterium]|nr:hypothetical protein [Clostridia bacterium]